MPSPLYNLGIRLYGAAIRIASLWSTKARQWYRGRQDWKDALAQLAPSTGVRIWMHAASTGEYEQGRPVLRALRKRFPDAQLIVSFFSPSGYEAKHADPLPDAVFYLPLDTPGHTRYWVDTLRPAVAIFVKYEVWPNLLQALHHAHIPAVLLSARFYTKQAYFKPWGSPLRKALHRFTHIIVQADETSAACLQSLGYTSYTEAPDTRFDRVVELSAQPLEVPVLENFASRGPTWIAGSIWPEDIAALAPAILAQKKLQWIIAPHDVSPSMVEKLEQTFSGEVWRYTHGKAPHRKRILLLDTVGLLSKVYRLGNAAYVGGGFRNGLHNTLEAAVYNIPVAFGPHYSAFSEAKGLLAAGAATVIANEEDAKNWVNRLLHSPQQREQMGTAAGQFVKQHTGGTEAAIDIIAPLIS